MKLTDAQRDALWGFLYSSSMNYDPFYERPKLSRDDYLEIAKADFRRHARGPMRPALVERLIGMGLVERHATNQILITAKGQETIRRG